MEYWGMALYTDFCDALGIQPMEYWQWLAKTHLRGIDWWHRELQLEHIKEFPPLSDYRMLVRTAHPEEADGPHRLYHCAAARAATMSPRRVHEMLWDELGGSRDPMWYMGVKQHVEMTADL